MQMSVVVDLKFKAYRPIYVCLVGFDALRGSAARAELGLSGGRRDSSRRAIVRRRALALHDRPMPYGSLEPPLINSKHP